MNHQAQDDTAQMSSRPRSRVIKKNSAAPAYERDVSSRDTVRRSSSRQPIDRAPEARWDAESRTVVRSEPDNSFRQRIRERSVSPPPAEESVMADVASDSQAVRWYQTRWFKFTSMATLLALMIAAAFLKPIDHSSESQIDSALTRALIGFGIARTLNGVISVAQGTEFAVQPAGVGVNFSPGEILDPINDLVERFSWVMLVATSSLGIQKILMDVSSWIGVSFMLAGAAVFWLLTRMPNGPAYSLAKFACRLFLVMLMVRILENRRGARRE